MLQELKQDGQMVMGDFSKGEPLKKRILLIEDDLALARVIQLRLERLNYEVILQADGESGLEVILGEGSDIILLDYKLPRMSGLDLMRRISDMDPMPLVIMLSGSSDLSVAVEAMKLGAADYVIKEVNRSYFDLLEAAIASCLDKQRILDEKQATEEHLARTSSQLRATLTSMNEGLSVFDSNLKLVQFNEQFQRMYGFPDDLVKVGTPLVDFFKYRYDKGELGTDDRDEVIAQKLAGAVPLATRIYEVTRPNGVVVEVRANPIPDGGFVSTHTDITSRKKSERALRDSEDNYRRMSEFASSVIHNVGNILSSINVSCGSVYRSLRDSKMSQLNKATRLLNENADTPNFLTEDDKGKILPGYLSRLTEILSEEHSETMEEIQGVLKNLMLITQIIEYQQSQGKRDELIELLDLRQVVEDALNVKMDAIMRESITVETKFDALLVRSQKAKLTHVLINLIKNSVEAMVDIPAGERNLLIQSGQVEGSDELYLNVTDTGVGITPANLANLFSHGFTTKSNGHGFGLHYCANALEEMGSRIEAHSQGEGKGTTMRLFFRSNSA